MTKRANVYIDDFNLYYGCLKSTTNKCLNVQKLCEFYVKEQFYEIKKIYYFTAKVNPTQDDPLKAERQACYIRALKTIPNLEVVAGHFITEKIILQKADGSGPIEVIRSKEKRSDVNPATLMLVHAADNHYDTAVLISADSDFRSPLEYVKTRFKKQIVVIDPSGATPGAPLNKLADAYKPIRTGAYRL